MNNNEFSSMSVAAKTIEEKIAQNKEELKSHTYRNIILISLFVIILMVCFVLLLKLLEVKEDDTRIIRETTQLTLTAVPTTTHSVNIKENPTTVKTAATHKIKLVEN